MELPADEPAPAVDAPLSDFRQELERFARGLSDDRRRLLELRFVLGMTQVEAAAELGMPRSTLEDWERRDQAPRWRRTWPRTGRRGERWHERPRTWSDDTSSPGRRRGRASDRRLWRHLRGCSPCRGRYRSRALLETLEPDGDERARRRLGRAVFAAAPAGAAPRSGRWAWRWRRPLVLLLVLPRRLLTAASSPRGGEPATGSGRERGLVVFRIPSLGRQGQPAERVGAVIRGGDGLAFSYLNPPEVAATHLMVFAVDGGGRVYWFWPEWRSAGGQPDARCPSSPAPAPIELPEACATICRPGR